MLSAKDLHQAEYEGWGHRWGIQLTEELHHLVDELPEEEVRPVLELIRGRADASHGARDLPFFASFESDPDLAERSEEILRAELGR
jgi:hypothetical protein